MKQFISQTISNLYRILQSGRNFITQISNVIFNLFSTYVELFQTGGIQSTREGDKVFVNLTANVCGDILVFIGPKDNASHSYSEVMEMILTDSALYQQKKLALDTLRAKFQGLMVLPKMLARLISVILSLLVYWKAAKIYTLFNYLIDLVAIQKYFPLILLIITFIFSKFIGFKIIFLFMRMFNFIWRIWLRLKSEINLIYKTIFKIHLLT